ncbi:MAG: hypothetical protein E7298_09035 [Lachnospiraceae bacterium]|nr:hypothetical protein [Lachnospiraceae bacterium]
MDINEDQKNEKIGRAIVNITWFWFVAKFIVVTTVIVGIVLYSINKPLWIAPLIGIGAFIIYRLFWRLIWLFISWASEQ